MRKLFAAVVAVGAFTGVAQADLILHVEEVFVLNGPGGTTGFFEVYLEETQGTEAVVQTYNVPLRMSPGGAGVTFTSVSAAQTHPSLFLGQVPQDRTTNVAGYVVGQDLYLTDEFPATGTAQDAPVENGTRDGLFRVNFSVDEGVLGEFDVNVDTNPTIFGLFELDGDEVPVVINNGRITVVPEPAALSLLAGVGVLALRRRRA